MLNSCYRICLKATFTTFSYLDLLLISSLHTPEHTKLFLNWEKYFNSTLNSSQQMGVNSVQMFWMHKIVLKRFKRRSRIKTGLMRMKIKLLSLGVLYPFFKTGSDLYLPPSMLVNSRSPVKERIVLFGDLCRLLIWVRVFWKVWCITRFTKWSCVNKSRFNFSLKKHS